MCQQEQQQQTDKHDGRDVPPVEEEVERLLLNVLRTIILGAVVGLYVSGVDILWQQHFQGQLISLVDLAADLDVERRQIIEAFIKRSQYQLAGEEAHAIAQLLGRRHVGFKHLNALGHQGLGGEHHLGCVGGMNRHRDEHLLANQHLHGADLGLNLHLCFGAQRAEHQAYSVYSFSHLSSLFK